MTIIKILGDGTSIPKLSHKFPIILLRNGSVFFGCFNADNYRSGMFYLEKPINHDELFGEIFQFVMENCLSMIEKKHPVHILCPPFVAQKMLWQHNIKNEQ